MESATIHTPQAGMFGVECLVWNISQYFVA